MSVIAAIEADFKTAPFTHQLGEFERSAEQNAIALLWQMRTGKTKVTIDTACHQAKNLGLDAVIVLAPNGVHENWIRRELPTHHWDTVERDTLTWRTDIAGKLADVKTKRKGWEEKHLRFWKRAERVLKTDKLAWFALPSEVVTRDDIRNLINRILRRKKRIMLVVDESDDYGAPGSKKTKMIRALAKKCAVRRILSGTVVENSPLKAYSQYEILEEAALGFEKYGDFKDHFAVYETETNRRGQRYPVLKGYKNLDELKKRMARLSSVVLREDCNDMPDLVKTVRKIPMSDEQVALYREVYETYMLDVGGEEVSIGENTSKLIKFQQIASGFIRDEYKRDFIIPGPQNRLEAIVDEVNLTPGQVVIWCAFRPDMDRVKKALENAGHKIITYHGRSSDDEKAAVRKAFAPGNDSGIKAVVGHPKSGGRGLDFSGAGKIIWYSHTFDAVVRSQADERATAVKGDNVQVVDFVSAPIDNYMLDNVRTKTDVAEDLARSGLKAVLEKISLDDNLMVLEPF